MKQYKVLLSALLLIALTALAAGLGSAEDTQEAWQADILKLMKPENAPRSTSIHYDLDLPADAEITRHTCNQELVSTKGDVLNVEFRFALNGVTLGDGQWATIDDWLKDLVLSAVQNVKADSESLANVVAESYQARRAAATAGETGMPIWASEDLMLEDVVATVPYYPVLKLDTNGSATQRLQQKLIQLGYLEGAADGFYGVKTEEAVRQLEAYVRELEQDVIDDLTGPTPTPTLEPTPTPRPTPTPQPNTIALAAITPMPTVAPSPTPEPEPTPKPTPMTPVDGVADGMLQAYLFSDEFVPAREDLKAGDEGTAVRRLQTRLATLGYTTDPADGAYSGGTARALRVFQYYSGVDQTGVADVATQNLLFAADAKAPDNAMLTMGSNGEDVSKLQKRLRVLGFASIAVDGGFGESTKAGVENLQAYMRELEGDALAASAEADDSQLTVEVNGVADPLLLDDFYSDSFPAIPADMSSGASGRDVVRLQRRLYTLEYYYSVLDGEYGSGTTEAVSAFQKRNGLAETGVADHATLAALFDENAKKALKPYVLKVSIDDQRVYAYAPDANGEYTELVRTMKCSTGRKGTPTPTGTFIESTGPGARWHYFSKFSCWAQYAYYIQGNIMFHSVLYNHRDGKVTQSSVNHLGSRASHGCVRLSVEDAKWIWTNCPARTKVIVY